MRRAKGLVGKQMWELGWQEMAGLAAGGGLGALLAHGYFEWVKPWLSSKLG